jgi:endonuclease G
MLKKLLLLIPIFLLAFTSKYTSNLNNFLQPIKCDKALHKTAFDICYSCKDKHPIVVAYILKGDLVKKKISRKGLSFRPDYNLPAKCRSYTKDYSRTGYDRGHLASNASFDYDRKIQKETFLMSNISPQKPQLNRRYWAKVEKFTRYLAVKYKQVEVVTGVCGNKGHIKNKVGIPAWWYKIIYIPELNKTVAFLAPNTNMGMSKAKLKEYKTTLEEIKRVCNF